MDTTPRHIRARLAIALVLTSLGAAAIAGETPKEGGAAAPDALGKPPTAEQITAGKAAFQAVHRVLVSPRCMNCHPAGDRPLQTDASTPHAMNISRASEAAGLQCSTCHQTQNADELVGAPKGAPPGAPNWHLPPVEHPMIFQGRSPAALCAQLKDPAQNGGKTLVQLLEHVTHDPLVAWGWHPGKGRSLPPLPKDEFVASFKTWVDAQGACPDTP
ncbi:MAG: hypothetical protein AAGI01_00880 [Myxococcota bacterium]